MKMEEPMEVVVRDWNRVLVMDVSADATLQDVLDKFAKGYRKVDENSVTLNGKAILPETLGCCLSSFAANWERPVFWCRTIKNKKNKEGSDVH